MALTPPTQPIRRLPNWIEAYMHFTRHHLAADEFHLWTALGVLSVAINRNRWMDGGYYKTYPNLYILFIGPSGVGKSSSSGIGLEILKDAKLQINIFSDFITAAALIDFMSLSTVLTEIDGVIEVKTPVMVYASEIGTLINQRSSIRELTLILTEMFNKNTDYENRTKGGGKTLIRNPNMTFFACCFPEWINEELDSISLRSGFLGRILTISSYKKRSRGDGKPTANDFELRKNLVHDLAIIANQYGEMVWSCEAKKALDKWTATLPLDLTSDDTIEVQGFVSRKEQYVQRVAMLAAISRSTTNEISLTDFQFGMEMVEKCEVNARRLNVKPDYVVHLEKLRRNILRLKKKTKSNIISLREISQQTHTIMSKVQREEGIAQLCSMGFCELVGRKINILDEKVGE